MKEHFEWSVRALAQPSDVQRSLFPSFVEVADELALDFDEHYRDLPSFLSIFTREQAQRIEELNAALDAASGPEHGELWTMEALDHSSEWQCCRELARRVIEAMGWSSAAPPANRAIYVGSDA